MSLAQVPDDDEASGDALLARIAVVAAKVLTGVETPEWTIVAAPVR
ncbi:hypothetical protein AB0F81_44280 [Actinoplanes sp. NPDC024001]